MDTWSKITDRMKSMQKRYDVMDTDKDLAYLDKYKLKNYKGKTISNAVSITSNSPARFANAIIADLMSATWQPVIEGNSLSDRKASIIERFVQDNLDQTDEVLVAKTGQTGLYEWLCKHVCIRGYIGAMWLGQIIDGKYVIDCTPYDMRWTPFVFGQYGLKWVANITYRDRDSLQQELEENKIDYTIGGHEDIEVRDYWDDKVNELWIETKLVKSQPHYYGKPPAVIVIPPSGFLLRDKGYLEHEAESIFYQNRDLYEELNRSMSIEQTRGMDILYPPYEQEVEILDGKPADTPPESGETKKVKKGERHLPVPRGDWNNASQVARQDIQNDIQLGGISDAELGDVNKDRPGIWYTQQWEIRTKLERDRLTALQTFREQLARMMVEQFRAVVERTKGITELQAGQKGKKNYYTLADIVNPDEYSIKYRVMTKSKTQEVANWALANAARGTAPMKIILRDILLVENPDEWLRELELEKAREADPAIGLFEMAVRYAQEAENLEDEKEADVKKLQSKMLTERGVSIIRERQMPVQPQLPENARVPQNKPERGNMQGLMSLPKLM